MCKWIVRGSFASFSRERESLISKPRNKPLGSNWERIERREHIGAHLLRGLLEATGKELKGSGTANPSWSPCRTRPGEATGKELKGAHLSAMRVTVYARSNWERIERLTLAENPPRSERCCQKQLGKN